MAASLTSLVIFASSFSARAAGVASVSGAYGDSREESEDSSSTLRTLKEAAKLLRQLESSGGGLRSAFRTVRRQQNTLQCGRLLRGVVAADQHRTMRVMQHPLGNTAHQEGRCGALAPAAHHDQIRLPLLGEARDRFHRMTPFEQSLVRHVRLLKNLAGMLFQRRPRFFGIRVQPLLNHGQFPDACRKGGVGGNSEIVRMDQQKRWNETSARAARPFSPQSARPPNHPSKAVFYGT